MPYNYGMITTAFSMLRVSGKGQIDGDGFERQRQCIAEYCLQNNIEIEREFMEKGVRPHQNTECR